MRTCYFYSLFMFICFLFETSVNPLIAGGPPLVTDDTGTPGHNKWEINLAYTRNNTIHEKTTDFTVDANYGLGERTQLNLMIPYTYIDNDEDGKDSHMGDIQLATKYRFIDETDWFFSVSVTPTISLPTDSHRSKPDFFLPLEFDRNIKSLYLGSQIGYVIHREKDHENELFYGFFGEYPVFGRIDVVGEISGFFTNHEKANSPQFITGLRYRFSNFLSAMGSAGTSFEGRSNGEPDFLGYIGIRFNF